MHSMDDAMGLENTYDSRDNHYVRCSTLYVSGTRSINDAPVDHCIIHMHFGFVVVALQEILSNEVSLVYKDFAVTG